MTRNDRMQKVMMRVLSVMLVTSFLLALVSFAFPQITHASSFWKEYKCKSTGSCPGKGWFYRWCGSNCSPPCGPWVFTNWCC